ncbi:MAG: tetratricopeptide repeat protein [Acidobacteriota bacterium]|nr:tetratricopeptide repeat protein [Acidobacteriota bacterium]
MVIKAEGYQVDEETISLPLGEASSVTRIIYLRPLDEKSAFPKAKGDFLLAPRAEKEVQRGLSDLRSHHFDSARKHVEKALRMAPGNPYVNYVMGMIYLLSSQAAQAKPFLEESVSVDPRQPPSLLALGTVRFRLGNYPGAIEVLEQAVQLDATSWQAEWMLADCYLREKNYAKGKEYAQRAIETGKENAAQAQLLLGEALAGLGEREKAATTFDNYLGAHPNDPNAAKIRRFEDSLRHPPAAPAKPAPEPLSKPAAGTPQTTPHSSPTEPIATDGVSAGAPPVELPPKKNWAPPDVDAVKPFVISSAACSLPTVLKAAQKNAEQFVNELQEFSAVEEYQTVEIKRDEQLERPHSRQFDYLVFISKTAPDVFDVQESREARSGGGGIPGQLADMGAPALALVFHPMFHDDFDWTCEGLGEWKGQPAWVVHFEQRKDRPTSRLAGFSIASQRLYLIPLKGRAWLTEGGGQLLHLETDLTHPQTSLDLVREHFAIDYGPVFFRTHKVQLWLPKDVDVYYQYRGHYIHNYHHYSDFKLFWVGTTQKISAPKQTIKRR